MVIFLINSYSIKNYNGEKIVYLYIDYNYEFGLDFNFKSKNSNMKKEIKKYLKKNKLVVNGEKIALMFGGILLAVLLVVENPRVLDNYDLVYVNSSILPKNEVEKVVKEEIVLGDKKEEVNTNMLVDEIKKQEVEKVTQISEEKKVESIPKINNNQEVKEDIKENLESIEEKTKEDSQIYVSVYRSNGSILNIGLEEYLIGVVGSEMPASFNIEALKVQAIISRTYALKSLKIGRKLTDTVTTQVYKDNSELKNIWGNEFDKYYNKIKEAIDSTKGMVIYYNNDLIDALFFSTSNGKTEDSKYVWGNSIPYLISVDSSWDKETTPYIRTINKEISEVLNVLGVENSSYNIISKDESGRVLEIEFGGKIFSGVEFRNLLGLRSSDFDLEIVDNTINITTRGYGHGVGLSQYGAGKMADNGYSYQDIIRHYYSGVEIRKG